MLAVIQKWGNHQGLSFTPEMLNKAQLSIGDEVFITVRQGKIIIKPTAQEKGKYTLAELVAKMPSDYTPNEEDWGKPVGKIESAPPQLVSEVLAVLNICLY